MSSLTAEISNLDVVADQSGAPIVRELSLRIAPGELMGLVGESGSGKTTVALALLGHLRSGMRRVSGEARVAGVDMFGASPATRRGVLRRTVSYVPQSAGFALDPAMRIERQMLKRATASTAPERRRMVRAALEAVALPDPDDVARRYPHQLSGGQQQRIVIAAAFLSNPEFVVLDEPTTGLDVTTQAQVLELLRRLCRQTNASALFISHDLGAVGELCDSVAVMYDGVLVESGASKDVLAAPRHPYTRALIEAVPDIEARHALRAAPPTSDVPAGATAGGCVYLNRCERAAAACAEEPPSLRPLERGRQVRCLFPVEGRVLEVRTSAPAARPAGDAGEGVPRLEIRDISASYRGHQVLRGISLRIPAGQTVGVVGESGSGKSTLSRVIAGLHAETSGTVLLAGEPLTPRAAKRSDAQLRDIQYVFQNPYDSLNPHHDIQTILSRPGRRFDATAVATYRPEELLDLVSLPKSVLRRLPSALSGGERQRVAIARAVAVSPKVLLCDEVTSSLDVSVQASVLRLLKDIQAELGMSMLFVTHNMAVVRHIADDVVVLKGGRIVEAGPVESMFAAPREAYTQALLSDVPDLWRSLAAWSEPDSGQSGRPELEQTA